MTFDWEIIVTSISTIFITLGTIWLKEYIIPKKLTTHLDKDNINSYIKLNQICRKIRYITQADGVYIAQFHNGGIYSNGVKMNKYTVVGEDYIPGIESYKRQYTNIHCNTISYLIHDLICSYKHIIEDVTSFNFNDNIYKDDLRKRNIKSTHSFLIKEPYSKKPLGFISLEFSNPQPYIKEKEDSIWKYENDIASVLNRKKLKV